MKLTVSAQETDVSGSGEGTTTTVNKIYVDGVGSGQKDGTSKDNAFATLVDALKAVPSNNVETYIIVCGEINVIDGATAFDTGTSRYILPQHAGKVIITSVYGTEGEEGYENYKSEGDLNFNKKEVFLLGETKFEHIRISTDGKKANIIYANFFPLHFGEGIECKTKVAETIDMGTRNHASILNSTVQTWLKKEQNVQLTIDSGVYGNVYGGSYNYQPSKSSAENNHTVITINGGKISGCLYGTGANNGGGNPPNNNVSKRER